MSVTDMNDLTARRDAMTGKASPTKDRTERIYKLFTPPERVALIKAEHETVRIGSGAEAREVTIRPMNPIGFFAAWALIRSILVPLVKVFNNPDGSPRQVSLATLIDALGEENIGKIPELVYHILKRGNDISLDWINEHLDLLLDLQLILPVFLKQNGLLKLLGNDDSAPTQTTEAEDTTRFGGPEEAQTTGELVAL